MLQLHGVGQSRRAFVQNQCDRVTRNLVLIQHADHARQSDGEFLRIGDVAAINVMTQTQTIVPIENIAETNLS